MTLSKKKIAGIILLVPVIGFFALVAIGASISQGPSQDPSQAEVDQVMAKVSGNPEFRNPEYYEAFEDQVRKELKNKAVVEAMIMDCIEKGNQPAYDYKTGMYCQEGQK